MEFILSSASRVEPSFYFPIKLMLARLGLVSSNFVDWRIFAPRLTRAHEPSRVIGNLQNWCRAIQQLDSVVGRNAFGSVLPPGVGSNPEFIYVSASLIIAKLRHTGSDPVTSTWFCVLHILQFCLPSCLHTILYCLLSSLASCPPSSPSMFTIPQPLLHYSHSR